MLPAFWDTANNSTVGKIRAGPLPPEPILVLFVLCLEHEVPRTIYTSWAAAGWQYLILFSGKTISLPASRYRRFLQDAAKKSNSIASSRAHLVSPRYVDHHSKSTRYHNRLPQLREQSLLRIGGYEVAFFSLILDDFSFSKSALYGNAQWVYRWHHYLRK